MTSLPFYRRIWFKLTTAISLFLAVTLGSSILFSLQTTQRQFHHVLQVEFSNGRNFITSSLRLMEESSTIKVLGISKDKELLQDLNHGNMEAVAHRLASLRQLSGLDELLLVDQDGAIIIRGSNSSVANKGHPKTLCGNPPTMSGAFICLDKQVINIFSPSPKIRIDHEEFYILAGLNLHNTTLQRLKHNSHINLSLLINTKLHASTLPAKERLALALTRENLDTLLTNPEATLLQTLAGHDVFVNAIALPHQHGGIEATMLLSHPQVIMQKAKDTLAKRFLMLTLISVTIAIILVTTYCRSILQPLQELRITAAAVGRGERTHRLDISSGDEFQLMADHFNTMLDVLETQDQALRSYNESLEQRILLRTKTLQEQNNFITSILQSNTTMAIAATDLDFKILYFNPMAEKIFGYESREAVGRTVLEMHEREQVDPHRFQRAVDTVKKEGSYPFHLEQNRDGQLNFIDGTLTAIRDKQENMSGYLLLATDVTDWKMLEARIRNALAELNIIFENTDQSIAFIRDHMITQVNSSFERLFGFRREEIIGKNRIQFWSQLFHGDYDSFWHQAYENFSQGHVVRQEVELHDKNGKRFWAALTGKAINPAELTQGVIWIIEDVSEKRQAQILLQEATEAAKLANNAKSDFLAKMSHEIRTPMSGIIGMTGLALASKPDATMHSYLENIKISADSLLQLINNILDFSKIEAGHMELENKPFDLHATLNTALQTAKILGQGKSVSFSLHMDPEVPQAVCGDSLRLGQIILNLLGNAIKFTEKGTIKLTVAMVAHEAQQNTLRFMIKDSGIGIAPDKLQGIFQSFSQEDSSISRRYGGSGLGLAICRQLCQLMGGDIEVSSQLGQGSTFSFQATFAPAEPHEISSQTLSPSELPTLAKLTILLVDDNRINRELAYHILEHAGHQIHTAVSGMAALEELAQQHYDVVLMDIQMPNMDGLQTTAIIRACEQGQPCPHDLNAKLHSKLTTTLQGHHLPIVAVTANAMTDDRQHCLEHGMDDYLTKPFEPEDALFVLARVLGFEPTLNNAQKSPDQQPSQPAEATKLDFHGRIRHHLHNKYLLDDEEMAPLLADLPDNLGTSLNRAIEAYNDLDSQKFWSSCHTLKGSLYHLGQQEEGDLARALELIGQQGEWPAPALLEELQHILTTALPEISIVEIKGLNKGTHQ